MEEHEKEWDLLTLIALNWYIINNTQKKKVNRILYWTFHQIHKRIVDIH